MEEAQVTPEELLDIVEDAADIYSNLTVDFLQKFIFYERSLFDWGTEMTIVIPQASELDELRFREIFIELTNKYQKASNYYAAANSLANAFNSGTKIRKSDVISALVNSYAEEKKRRPASTVLDQMAESYLKSTVSTKVVAFMVKDFWKQRLDMLMDVRRMLEQIGMSLHVELKHLMS